MNAPSKRPRPHPPRRSPAWLVATLVAVLGTAGCATMPGDVGATSDTDAAAPDLPVVAEPAPVVGDATTETPAAQPAAAASSDTTPATPALEPSPVVEAPQRYGPEGRYFPAVPSRVLFAGLRLVHGAAPLVVHIEQDARPAGDDRAEFSQAITDGERKFVEHFVARMDANGLHVGLAEERLRAVPPPSREIPRRPRVGETWSVSLGGSTAHCRVEELESATTFDGEIEGCVRVRIDHPSGAVHRRWYHPERGLVRAEARDHDGHLLSGWAVTADAWPDMDRLKRMFVN